DGNLRHKSSSMRIITNIEPRNIDIIHKYVEEGHYRNLAEFVDVAIQNQIALEEMEANELGADARQFQTRAPRMALEGIMARTSRSPLKTIPGVSDATKPLLRK